jgi:hypothetical protein
MIFSVRPAAIATTAAGRFRHLGFITLVGAIVPGLLFGAATTGPAPTVSDFAVYATGATCNAIVLSGNAYMDSFDSSLGSYAQTKQSSQAIVGVSGNINLSGQATIYGPLFALNTAVGSCKNGKPGITLSGQAVVTGGYISLGAAPSYPNPAAVTPGSQDYNFASNASLSPGSYGNIIVSGASTLTLLPGIYNVNSISVSGQGRLTINPSGAVIINVAGNKVSQPIQLAGGGIANTSAIPLNFQLVYGGNLPITLSGGSSTILPFSATEKADHPLYQLGRYRDADLERK